VKISVIMPSYNHAEFIGKAIDSVLSQTGDFELELIVMDGNSTDATQSILKQYGQAIRWRSEPDEGQADAFNKGLALARGDVIGWLNSDDLYEPEALATVAEIFASEPQTQWLYGKVRIIDIAGREIRRWITAYKNWRMRRFSYPKLLTENWISQMGVFWRRSAGQQVGPFRTDLHWCLDYDYWLRLGARWPGRFVNKYLADFRWYSASKSGAGYLPQFREELKVATQRAEGRHPFPIFLHCLNAAKIITVYWMLGLRRRLTAPAAKETAR
jgi:glycosyltransferase involved in cell wall biosynthesis